MRDITRLDVRLLLAFDALMEERSVTRAARRLNMTQQGLSGALQRMRHLFADPLFVRGARGVLPTPWAEALAPRIKAAIAGLEGVLESQEFNPATAEGTVFVAASDYALNTVVSPLFQRFRSLVPKVRLAVLPLDTGTLSEQMRSGRVDLALTTPQFAPQNLYAHCLSKERYFCAVRRDHPLARRTVDIDAFCDCEHLIVSPDKSDFTGATDIALARINRARRVGLVVPSYSIVGDILEHTDLLAVLPERVLRNMDNRLHIFAPPLDIESFELLAVWPRRVHQDHFHAWFRRLCHESSQGLWLVG